MARPVWKGVLRLSLVTVPVRAYTALVTGQGEIHLNQLHKECHSRIRYQKTCPIHGEVTNDEIVMGYEYAKGHYVEIDDEERDRARSQSDKAIEIDKFVPLAKIEPVFFQGRNYYLLPDGATGQKPYAVLHKAMVDEKRCAVAQVAFSGRDQVVTVLPRGPVLVMCFLNYAHQLKDLDEFAEEAPDIKPRAEELKLAKTLIESTFADELKLESYTDNYDERLKKVIDDKVEGHEVLIPPADEEPQVVNLMDALRKSVAKSKGDSRMTKRAVARHVKQPKRRKSS